MEAPALAGSVSSVIARTAHCLINRKSRHRRAGGAASHLISVLDEFAVECAAVATDNRAPFP